MNWHDIFWFTLNSSLILWWMMEGHWHWEAVGRYKDPERVDIYLVLGPLYLDSRTVSGIAWLIVKLWDLGHPPIRVKKV